MSVFNPVNVDHLNQKMFFGPPVNIARYEKVKYKNFEQLTEKQISFFWQPSEIDLTKDSKDFKDLSKAEQHIFTSNLKRQILLDSVQGRAPALAFLPLCSLPELETFIAAWTFFETIHSRSYTHIIRNVYSNPSKIFDEMLDIQEIVDCAKDISKYYDSLISFNGLYGDLTHKRQLWLALNAVNALEGIRFYGSFAASWAFAEVKKMEGNAKIIKLIARDENLHLAATQQMLKLLPQEDDDFKQISIECADLVKIMWLSVIEQEKAWGKYLFQYGSMIGLNEKLFCDYVDWVANKRMQSIGIPVDKPGNNPLPWTQKWIAGSEVQIAAQEAALSSYTIGAITQDVTSDTFSNFEL